MEYQCHFDYNDLSTIVIVIIQNISHIVVSIVHTYLVPVTRMGCSFCLQKNFFFCTSKHLEKRNSKMEACLWKLIYKGFRRCVCFQILYLECSKMLQRDFFEKWGYNWPMYNFLKKCLFYPRLAMPRLVEITFLMLLISKGVAKRY